MAIKLIDGTILNSTQQQKIIQELKDLGNTEEAEMLEQGNLWEEEFLSDLVEDMREEGQI